ncbi:Pls/PosA family non-ribosomal peptide synthetase [Pseudonocardia sp. RS010]|uniref:Pls/PosA family non-ribosomal peptide synthetase n=1 Tax=Pseudonocardia sp. RS010 TaxID=3385979 RepID=UPI0039A3F4B9
MPSTPASSDPEFERVVSAFGSQPEIPLGDLVVVDRHEAQGWRVRRHERLDYVFEERCDWMREYGREGHLAVDGPETSLTYDELDARSNRLARYLRLHGAGTGDRIALLFDDRVDCYVALLAVLKIGGSCVPLDPAAPVDRLTFVLADAAVRIVLSCSHLPGRVAPTGVLLGSSAEVVAIDEAAALIREMSPQRLQPVERGGLTDDRPAYIVHVADASGWSEAVAVDHRSICNAVRIASETFGVRGHRLYQGGPLFSGSGVGEVWMAWAAGATLVPARHGPPQRGAALAAELAERRVSALCTTPAVLSTLKADLPALRLLLVSGEPCPPSLVARWDRPSRRVLSVYVPPGATVAAAWTEVHADDRVMIGVPLPTYAIVVLDPDFPRALPHGETGEIGLAGLGLACGYADASGDAFIEDFLRIPGNPSGRIFRTGDLGRVGPTGEVEYRGRLSLQVSLNGERVDLTAVESAMLAVPGVASAAVTAHSPQAAVTELSGFYTCFGTQPAADEQAIWSSLRDRLPARHLPARLHRVDALPLTVEGRVDRSALPALLSTEERNRLLLENTQLHDELEGLHSAEDLGEQPASAVPPDPVPPSVPSQHPGIPNPDILTFDQILRRTEDAESRTQPQPAQPPREQPEILTSDQIVGTPPPAPPPSAPYSSPSREKASPAPRPSPYPRTTATGAPPSAGPTPYPRTAAPTAAIPTHPARAWTAATPLAAQETATATAGDATATAGLAAALAGVLAEVLEAEHVPTDSNVFDDLGADSMMMTRFCARLRKRGDLPSISIKDVYAHPTIAGLATAFAPSTPAAPVMPSEVPGNDVVQKLAQVLAEVLGVDSVPTDRNVFDDLGADSMVMTRFCARLRKREDLPSISIRDVYANPTIVGMAAAAMPGALMQARPSPLPSAPTPVTPVRHSTFGYLLTGFLQLLGFLLYATGAGIVMDRAYAWISTSVGELEIYVRSVTAGAAAFVTMALLPIVLKWLLIGRWRQKEIPVWSLRYFRFWLVKTLVRANPLVFLMVGSPLYTLYLRALGAKVGKNVAIFTRHLPICTDLLSIGSGTVIRKDVYFQCYRAHFGRIQTGRVTLGRDVVVGERSVLDIDTVMGDGAQLGHASALHRGQSVPTGQSWHGSPAVSTGTDFRAVPPTRVRVLRKITYVTSQLVKLFGIYLPLGFGGLFLLITEIPRLAELLQPGAVGYRSAPFYLNALIESTILVFGSLAVGLLIVLTVPRLLALFVRPDRVYPIHGWRYSMQRTVTRLTNVKTFVYLFGDSSYIVGYLYLLGYNLGKWEQTGSNFGSNLAQESPFLASVGRGTVVADGLSVNNVDFTSTSFRLSRVSIGDHNFLGNNIAYPIGGRTGDDCLLANKVAVPIDGPVRQGVGLLGSPAFEIPRTVQRDRTLELDARERRRRLRRKNGHNLRTIALVLLVRWGNVLGLLLLGLLALDHFQEFGAAAFAAELVASLMFTILWFVLWERLVVWFRRLRPQSCSIYDPIFWRHERFWKMVVPPLERLLGGTPWKNLIARMLGVRVGRCVFDDGSGLTERTLTTIGDDCTLNAGAIIQCHSQEDGAFKSDRTTLGAGVTVGVYAFIHYGVSIGDGVEIAPDSFVMKGEEIPAGARWGGNPAQELPEPQPLASSGDRAYVQAQPMKARATG